MLTVDLKLGDPAQLEAAKNWCCGAKTVKLRRVLHPTTRQSVFLGANHLGSCSWSFRLMYNFSCIPTYRGYYRSIFIVSPTCGPPSTIIVHPPSSNRLGAPNNLTSKTSSNSCSTFIFFSDWSGFWGGRPVPVFLMIWDWLANEISWTI